MAATLARSARVAGTTREVLARCQPHRHSAQLCIRPATAIFHIGRLEMLAIEYELNEEDLVAATRHKLYRPQALRSLRTTNIGVLVVCGVLLAYGIHAHRRPLAVGAAAGLAVTIAQMAVRRAGYNWYAETIGKRLAKRFNQAGVLGQHVVTLSADGVRETSAVSESLTKWEGVHSVEANDTYVLIFLTELLVHVIPKRAFATQADADQFLSEALKHWNAARRIAAP